MNAGVCDVGVGVLGAALVRTVCSGDLRPPGSVGCLHPVQAPRAASVGPAPASPDQGGPLGWRGCVDVTLVSHHVARVGLCLQLRAPGVRRPVQRSRPRRGVCTLSFACSVMKFGPD